MRSFLKKTIRISQKWAHVCLGRGPLGVQRKNSAPILALPELCVVSGGFCPQCRAACPLDAGWQVALDSPAVLALRLRTCIRWQGHQAAGTRD